MDQRKLDVRKISGTFSVIFFVGALVSLYFCFKSYLPNEAITYFNDSYLSSSFEYEQSWDENYTKILRNMSDWLSDLLEDVNVFWIGLNLSIIFLSLTYNCLYIFKSKKINIYYSLGSFLVVFYAIAGIFIYEKNGLEKEIERYEIRYKYYGLCQFKIRDSEYSKETQREICYEIISRLTFDLKDSQSESVVEKRFKERTFSQLELQQITRESRRQRSAYYDGFGNETTLIKRFLHYHQALPIRLFIINFVLSLVVLLALKRNKIKGWFYQQDLE